MFAFKMLFLCGYVIEGCIVTVSMFCLLQLTVKCKSALTRIFKVSSFVYLLINACIIQ